MLAGSQRRCRLSCRFGSARGPFFLLSPDRRASLLALPVGRACLLALSAILLSLRVRKEDALGAGEGRGACLLDPDEKKKQGNVMRGDRVVWVAVQCVRSLFFAGGRVRAHGAAGECAPAGEMASNRPFGGFARSGRVAGRNRRQRARQSRPHAQKFPAQPRDGRPTGRSRH